MSLYSTETVLRRAVAMQQQKSRHVKPVLIDSELIPNKHRNPSIEQKCIDLIKQHRVCVNTKLIDNKFVSQKGLANVPVFMVLKKPYIPTTTTITTRMSKSQQEKQCYLLQQAIQPKPEQTGAIPKTKQHKHKPGQQTSTKQQAKVKTTRTKQQQHKHKPGQQTSTKQQAKVKTTRTQKHVRLTEPADTVKETQLHASSKTSPHILTYRIDDEFLYRFMTYDMTPEDYDVVLQCMNIAALNDIVHVPYDNQQLCATYIATHISISDLQNICLYYTQTLKITIPLADKLGFKPKSKLCMQTRLIVSQIGQTLDPKNEIMIKAYKEQKQAYREFAHQVTHMKAQWFHRDLEVMNMLATDFQMTNSRKAYLLTLMDKLDVPAFIFLCSYDIGMFEIYYGTYQRRCHLEQ